MDFGHIANIHWQDHDCAHRLFLSDRSRSCAGSNPSSSQVTVWTCSQNSRGDTCPLSFAVPHRSVTQSPSRPELEAMARQPSKQDSWLDQLRMDNSTHSTPPILCRETSRHTWTLGGDAIYYTYSTMRQRRRRHCIVRVTQCCNRCCLEIWSIPPLFIFIFFTPKQIRKSM